MPRAAALLLCAMAAQAQPVDPAPTCAWLAGAGRNVQHVGDVYLATWHCRSADRYAGWQRQTAAFAPGLLAADAAGRVKQAAMAGDFAPLVVLG